MKKNMILHKGVAISYDTNSNLFRITVSRNVNAMFLNDLQEAIGKDKVSEYIKGRMFNFKWVRNYYCFMYTYTVEVISTDFVASNNIDKLCEIAKSNIKYYITLGKIQALKREIPILLQT